MDRNCIGETHYQEDVQFIIESGFDGVKIDNCGASHNVTLWAELFNKSGKPIRIESCHTFHPNHGTPSGWPNFPVWVRLCFTVRTVFCEDWIVRSRLWLSMFHGCFRILRRRETTKPAQ